MCEHRRAGFNSYVRPDLSTAAFNPSQGGPTSLICQPSNFADTTHEPVLHVRRETQWLIGGRTASRHASAFDARRGALAGTTSAARARHRDGVPSPVKNFRHRRTVRSCQQPPFTPHPMPFMPCCSPPWREGVRGRFEVWHGVCPRESRHTDAIESLPSGLHRPKHKEHHDILS